FWTGFSRASISVASRAIAPMMRPPSARSISAAWILSGSSPRANSANTPEDELGREPDEGAPNARNDSEFPGLDQLTADAQAALTKLGANDAEHIRLALE